MPARLGAHSPWFVWPWRGRAPRPARSRPCSATQPTASKGEARARHTAQHGCSPAGQRGQEQAKQANNTEQPKGNANPNNWETTRPPARRIVRPSNKHNKHGGQHSKACRHRTTRQCTGEEGEGAQARGLTLVLGSIRLNMGAFLSMSGMIRNLQGRAISHRLWGCGRKASASDSIPKKVHWSCQSGLISKALCIHTLPPGADSATTPTIWWRGHCTSFFASPPGLKQPTRAQKTCSGGRT